MITFKKSVTRQQVVLVLLIVSPPAVQQSINISCTPGPQQQTLCSGMQQSSGTDRQMDGQTDGCTKVSTVNKTASGHTKLFVAGNLKKQCNTRKPDLHCKPKITVTK